jgi:hypothetical protein
LISKKEINKLSGKPALRWLFVKILGIQEGILSNYPVCCIAWFLFREDTIMPFSVKNEKFWLWYSKNFLRKNKNTQHIQCPYHQVIQKNPQLLN